MRDLFGYALYSLVGLIGVTLVYSVFANTEADAQIERMNSELMMFVMEIRKAHRAHPSRYGTAVISDANLINAGIAPQTTISGTNLINSFGGAIEVTGVSNNAFRVLYDDVPREICIQALSRLRPDDRVDGVRVASKSTGVAAATLRTFPVSFATATTACANAENAIGIEAR